MKIRYIKSTRGVKMGVHRYENMNKSFGMGAAV